MMKVYICPTCGWIRTVSRRKDVECYKCGKQDMQQTRLTYEKYSEMSAQEREDYAQSWMYIHRNSSGQGMDSKEQHV